MKKRINQPWIWIGLVVLLLVMLALYYFSSASNSPSTATGLNTSLPHSTVQADTSLDKFSFYAFATADSIKRLEQQQLDPYLRKEIVVDEPEILSEAYPSYTSPYHKPIQTVVQPVAIKEDEESEVDTALATINETLDKLAALQQLDTKGSVNHTTHTKQPTVYEVVPGERMEDSYFGRTAINNNTFFYNDDSVQKNGNIIAIIPHRQVVQSGATIRLALNSSVLVQGIAVPKGTIISGICLLRGERLLIQIPSIRLSTQLVPVALSVYDLDGLEGIYVPGSLARDVVKQSADEAVQSIGISGVGASLSTQALSVGVGAAKGLLSRKVKAMRVTLSPGYQVLLVDQRFNR